MPPPTPEPRDEAQFHLQTERLSDSTFVVSVLGEIDLFTGPRFADALFGALNAGATKLVVDLTECGFMDSTGVRILLLVNEELDHAHRPVAVVTDNENVRQVIELTGIDTVVGLYPSRSTALDGASD
jgi:anti-sigma B factor antagonist